MTAGVATDLTLVVAECYTGVWQGEGPTAGRRCSFIRLGGCNLTCGWARGKGGLTRVDGAWACDEAFTWHSAHDLHATLARIHVADLLARIDTARDPLVVLTGGEPLLHQDDPAWRTLTDSLLGRGVDVEVETNGTIIPAYAHRRLRYNVSPKLACSGLPRGDRLVPEALTWHAGHPGSVFKFVVTSPADVDEAAEIAHVMSVPPGAVWIMPEGITSARVLAVARDVAPAVAAHGFNLTLRQQVLLYEQAGEPRDR